jgi:hypothetical protein
MNWLPDTDLTGWERVTYRFGNGLAVAIVAIGALLSAVIVVGILAGALWLISQPIEALAQALFG